LGHVHLRLVGEVERPDPDGSKGVPRMAQPAVNGRSNILTKLDQRVPTRFYWQLTLLATLGGFLFGYDTSNIGSALNFVPTT
jgi:hypothetical protein